MVKPEEWSNSWLERFQLLLEESLKAIDELKAHTYMIAEGLYNEPEELERIVRECQTLRLQIDKNLAKMNELSAATSRYFFSDDRLRSLYSLFREKLREAQDVTLRAMHSLKVNMEKLDNEMVRVRQKHKAIKNYKK
ncbi:MAG: hypothetical protein N2260_03560 [Syntrophobacterales bacterium]|nr:hypothetical protein [Syntrophobacterales bacterium]